ncbi:MAG TPA: hypothetical protein VEF07_10380 [Candidatus Binataceae bacterium]|jgi:hypothetical protein|nr:hypothetical protein [Candidatus Binataceae bacterium]
MSEEFTRNGERKEMSPQETTSETAKEEESRDADRDSDSVASKLSKELSNWRRRRTSGRPRRGEAASANYQSESARTIKVRGHETLVIRKPKLAKPSVTTTEGSEH